MLHFERARKVSSFPFVFVFGTSLVNVVVNIVTEVNASHRGGTKQAGVESRHESRVTIKSYQCRVIVITNTSVRSMMLGGLHVTVIRFFSFRWPTFQP